MTIKFLDDTYNVVELNMVEIEKSDVRIPYDKHIRTVEVENGWWELFQMVDGYIGGYFEKDE